MRLKRFPALTITLTLTIAMFLAAFVVSGDALWASSPAGKLRVRSETGYQENQIEIKRDRSAAK